MHFRALKFVFLDFESDYDTLLSKCGSCTLEINRMRQIAIQTFKILAEEGPCYLKDFVKERSGSYAFRYNRILEKPRTKTVRYGTKSFRHVSVDIWNSLPDHMRMKMPLKDFKNVINKWHGQTCKCAACK